MGDTELYYLVKNKILGNIKRLTKIKYPTLEQENTLLELSSNINFNDFKKVIHYNGNNTEIPKCFIPPSLLVKKRKYV